MRKIIKKMQKRMTCIVNKLNASVEKDEIWRGRFFIHQTKIKCYKFADGSGCEAYFLFDAIDRETRQIKHIYLMSPMIYNTEFNNIDTSWISFHLWEEFNNFVCNQTYNLSYNELKAYPYHFKNETYEEIIKSGVTIVR